MLSGRQIKYEHLFFILAFVIAIGVRFIGLGNAPLSEAEATWALKALSVSRAGILTGIGTSSANQAYVVLTALLFDIFGSNNFLARFWPAFSGLLLVFVPYLVSRKNRPSLIPGYVAIVLAFGIALTPSMVTVSRQAGSPMMALGFSVLGLVLLYNQSALLGGMMLGVGLLSGTSIIPGLLSLIAAWILYSRIQSKRNPDNLPTQYPVSGTDGSVTEPPEPAGTNIKLFVLAIAVTILLLSTFFFQIPSGLAAWVDTFRDYLIGWTQAGSIPMTLMFAALIFYQPVALTFSIAGLVQFYARKNSERRLPITEFYLLWMAIILPLTLIYPARQPADLVWVVLPMWGIAAICIGLIFIEIKFHPISVVQSSLIVFLMGLIWYTLSSLSQIPSTSPEYQVRWIVIAFILILGALTTILITLGWSWSIAQSGLVIGIIAGLSLYAISALSGAAYLRVNSPQELWSPPPGSGDTKLFSTTLTDLSLWSTGRRESIDVISEVDSSSLRWLLRNFPNVQYKVSPDVSGLPSILITRQSEVSPEMAASYRGQDFVWWVNPGWSGGLPGEWLNWFIFRKAPLIQENIILWARSDLFPGGILTGNNGTTTAQPEEDPFEQDLIDAIDALKQNAAP